MSLLGSSFTIDASRTLIVAGTTTIATTTHVNIESHAQWRRNFLNRVLLASGGSFAFNSGTLIVTNSTVNIGSLSMYGETMTLPAGKALIDTATTVGSGGVLTLAGGKFFSSSGLTNSGLVTGSGLASTALTNNFNGRVESNTGSVLEFTPPSTGVQGHSNAGTIALLGGAFHFDGNLTNLASGEITGNGNLVATGLFFNQGVVSGRGVLQVLSTVNGGLMQFSAGFSDVYGGVTNDSRMTITGGSTTTFYDNVNNSAGSITVNNNSTAVFLGTLIGISRVSLIGSGTMDVEGGFSGGPIVGALGSVIIGPSSTGNTDFVNAKSLSVYGSASLTPNGTAASVSRVNSLSIAGGTLDLADNDLIVDYTGASPIVTIASALMTAYNHGAWTGGGLTSSKAAAMATDPSGLHRTALGFAEASALGIASFDGQSIDPTTVLIRYTVNGDAES